ncbi:MAG: hypothetical protein R2825_12730 [Saprospiraceae bacterium]
MAYQSGKEKFPKVDAVFNIIHGPFGEDGTMQGLLAVLGLPYVGPDTLGSSVGMDKDFTKDFAGRRYFGGSLGDHFQTG